MLVRPSRSNPILCDTALTPTLYRNAVTTATQLRTNRFLGASPHALTLSRAIMAEVAAVARAKGLTVPEGTEEGLIVKCTSVKEGLPRYVLSSGNGGFSRADLRGLVR